MAAAETLSLGNQIIGNHVPAIMRPAQLAMTPGVAVLTGAFGLAAQDAANLLNPDTEILAGVNQTARRIVKCAGMGTLLRAAMVYDIDLAATVTDPVIVVFGRSDETAMWRWLPNKAATRAVTIVTDLVNDARNADYRITEADPLVHSWDLDGSDEIVIGVQTPVSTTGAGDPEDTTLVVWTI